MSNVNIVLSDKNYIWLQVYVDNQLITSPFVKNIKSIINEIIIQTQYLCAKNESLKVLLYEYKKIIFSITIFSNWDGMFWRTYRA